MTDLALEPADRASPPSKHSDDPNVRILPRTFAVPDVENTASDRMMGRAHAALRATLFHSAAIRVGSAG